MLELHGSILRAYCSRCRKPYPGRRDEPLRGRAALRPAAASCGPDIVLYEEMLDDGRLTERAVRYIRDAEVLIIGGTSLGVYPAAGLINYYRGRQAGAREPLRDAV